MIDQRMGDEENYLKETRGIMCSDLIKGSEKINIYDNATSYSNWQKEPLLKKKNKIKRLNYAQRHKKWNSNEKRRVLWSDESMLELFGAERRRYATTSWRRVKRSMLCSNGEESILEWAVGVFSADGDAHQVRIRGTMDVEKYRFTMLYLLTLNYPVQNLFSNTITIQNT